MESMWFIVFAVVVLIVAGLYASRNPQRESAPEQYFVRKPRCKNRLCRARCPVPSKFCSRCGTKVTDPIRIESSTESIAGALFGLIVDL